MLNTVFLFSIFATQMNVSCCQRRLSLHEKFFQTKDVERHQFTAKITKRDFGRMYYTVVFAPKAIEKALRLQERPRLRIEGSVDGVPFAGAFHPNGGSWYLMLSKRLLKENGLALGDEVLVALREADQNKVDVPDELMAELRRRTEAMKAWEALTPGRRRGLAHRVALAKRPETREQRVLAILDEIMLED